MKKKKKIKILCMTGTRADYPRVKPVLQLLRASSKFHLELIVTGQHLERKFGYTIKEIERDGYRIFKKVKIFGNDDSIYGMGTAFEKCFTGIKKALIEFKPDIFLITVDRIETMAAANAGFVTNTPMAHIQGGEVTGTMDETIRHCVTKISHIHFPATKDASKRIISMGEDKKNVYRVGCPYIEDIQKMNLFSKKEICQQFGIGEYEKFALLTQHPVTSEQKDTKENLKKTILALKRFPEVKVIALFSNADAGGRFINKELKKDKNFNVFINLNERKYLTLMKYASFMIGNSSAGIREAPSFGTPVINIGTRQQGRLRAKNVIDVNHNVDEIIYAIKKCLNDKYYLKSIKKIKNPYFMKNTSLNIVNILGKLDYNNFNIQKIFHDKL